MKKLVSMLLVVMFCFASLGAAAANVPSFMDKTYNNYTADYKFSMKIDNAQEIVGFLKELDTEEIDKFIDVKALIESLFDVSSVLNVQADISADFRKISASITTEAAQDIVFNRNYEMSYKSKMGIWTKVDIDKKEFVVVYSTPINEKYAVIDVSKDLPQEAADEIFAVYDKMFNREIMEKFSKEIIEIMVEHAEVSVKGNSASVHFDNDSFIAAIEAVLEYMKKFFAEIALTVDGMDAEFPEIPSLKGIKLLGEEGITCTYKLLGNTIKSFNEKWDISISLADIFTKLSGEPWEYVFSGNINFTFETSGNVTKIGSTKVSMPALTEKNSFYITDLLGDIFGSYEYEEEYPATPYISSYAWGYTETDTFDGERYYLPVRMCIEDVYYDYADITYDKGNVTINTTCGIADREINASFNVYEDKAVVNGATYEGFGGFRMIDGSVYASIEFFEKCLGWALDSFQKDLINGTLYYGFYTEDMDFINILQ